MTDLRRVAVDARMIGHSGIGVVLRMLLRQWQADAAPFRLHLLGDARRLAPLADGLGNATVSVFDAPLYGPAALAASAPVGDAQVLLTPHYSAPLRTPVPVVPIVQDLVHITHPPRRGTAAYMRTALAALRRKVPYTITPSRHTKVQLQTLYRFPAHRVLTWPYGPGLAELAPEDAPSELELPEKYLLAAGLVKPHKNWPFLLERLAAAGDAPPLVAAGVPEAQHEDLRALARRCGLADERLITAPHLSDRQMVGLLQKAQLLLFPSLVEGFGLPLLEAMALGTPVLAANLPPMNEIGGGAVAVFDPDVPETFDARLAELLGEERERRERSAAGKARAEEFSWQKFARGVEETLRRAVEER